MSGFLTTFASVGWSWRRSLIYVTAMVCLGAGNAAAQAVVEHGSTVSTFSTAGNALGKESSALQPLRAATIPPNLPATSSNQTPSAHLPVGAGEDFVGANRRALEAKAGKDGAKLMLRSSPVGASVWIDGKVIGKTPLLVVVAPGVYQVEMQATQMVSAHQQVDLLPKEAREVLLTLASRYPARVALSWQHH